MRLLVDGREVELAAACLAGPGREPAPLAFSLAFSANELVPHLEEELRVLAAQAETTGDVYGAAEHELARRGWPAAAPLLAGEPALVEALVREAGLGERLLARLVPAPGARRGPAPRWALRRVDGVRLDARGGELTGRALDRRAVAGDGPRAGEEAEPPGASREEAGRGRKERKARAEGAQKLGVRLLELAADELRGLGLPGELVEAVELARRLKAREALRRQLQLIGKLMRGLDTAALREYFAERDEGRAREVDRFQRIERWRQALVAGETSVLQEILDVCPAVDLAHLDDLAVAARAEAAEDRPPRGARALFRYLRALLEQSGMD